MSVEEMASVNPSPDKATDTNKRVCSSSCAQTDIRANSSVHIAIDVLPTTNNLSWKEITNSAPQCFPRHHTITHKPITTGTKIGQAGSGPGEFSYPEYIAVDRTGMVFVSDVGNSRIQKLTTEGSYVTHWKTENFKPGPLAINHQRNELVCVKNKPNFLQILKRMSNKLIIYSFNGIVNKEFELKVSRVDIIGVDVNSSDQIVCCDAVESKIFVVSLDGDILHKFGSNGSGPGEFYEPVGVCIGCNDDIIVGDSGNYRIQILDKQGHFKHQFGRKEFGEKGLFVSCLDALVGSEIRKNKGAFKYVAVDQFHRIFVSDFFRRDIQMFSYSGEFVNCISSAKQVDDKIETLYPDDLAITPDNHVLVADTISHCILKFSCI